MFASPGLGLGLRTRPRPYVTTGLGFGLGVEAPVEEPKGFVLHTGEDLFSPVAIATATDEVLSPALPGEDLQHYLDELFADPLYRDPATCLGKPQVHPVDEKRDCPVDHVEDSPLDTLGEGGLDEL